MEPVAKRARTGGGGSAGDRLSTLPDVLLHAVMSFLPARQAVQTCVLSKRWRHLWCSMPCLNLDSGDFPGSNKEKWDKMWNFNTNLLVLHHAPTLDIFRLSIGFDVDHILGHCRDIGRWIRGGMKNCPQVLDIHFSLSCAGYDPPDLGSSSCRLKRLHISGVNLTSSFEEQLRAGCPVLEDLDLFYCCIEFSHVQSGTLKRLAVRSCITPSFDSLVISAPCLASLRLIIPCKNGVSLNGVNSLVEASVSVMPCEISPRGEAILLCGLFSVTNLELKGIKALAVLDEEFNKFSLFNNLRTLSLDDCFQGKCDLKDKFRAFERLLEMCPNLEKLTLQSCRLLQGSVTERAKRKTRTSGLLLQSQDHVSFHCQKLKLIEIKYDDELGCDHQLFQLMWLFWKNLKKATVILTKI